jgi:hypothetical protein
MAMHGVHVALESRMYMWLVGGTAGMHKSSSFLLKVGTQQHLSLSWESETEMAVDYFSSKICLLCVAGCQCLCK